MARVEFLALPNELLHLICSKLCSHCRSRQLLGDYLTDQERPLLQDEKKALSNLSLASRRLRDIAQPILYHSLHIHSIDPLDLYVRVLCSQVRLADCVKSATITHGRDRLYSEEDTRFFKGLAADFNLGHVTYCPMSRLRLCLLELLLAQVRNIEALDLTITFRSYKDGFAALRHPDIAGYPAVMLSSMRALRLRSPQAFYFSLDRIPGIFLSMPNLTHLHLDRCTGNVPDGLRLEALTHLKLNGDWCLLLDVESLLVSCKKLESFKIMGVDQNDRQLGISNTFSPLDVAEALSPHQGSLRELFMRPSTPGQAVYFEKPGIVKSLSQFTALEVLTIDTSCVIPEAPNTDVADSSAEVEREEAGHAIFADLLPSSIRSFCYIDDLATSEASANLERLANAIQAGNAACAGLVEVDRLRTKDGGQSAYLKESFRGTNVRYEDVLVSQADIFERFLEDYDS